MTKRCCHHCHSAVPIREDETFEAHDHNGDQCLGTGRPSRLPDSAPDISDPTEAIVLDAPGLCYGNTTFDAYHYLITQRTRRFTLRVRHGGGDEHVDLPSGIDADIVQAWKSLPEETCFLTLHALFQLQKTVGQREGMLGRREILDAHAEGRLKRRKIRNTDAYKCWVESRA